MYATAARLLHAIATARLGLLALSETEAAARPAPDKWSTKEIIGHLIDSATNNHQRFVRAQQGQTDLNAYRYAPEFWVQSQDYQAADWHNLVALWYAYNVHLAHVVARIRPEFLDTLLQVWGDEPATLRFVAEDYVRHLRHHLGQVFTEKNVAYPATKRVAHLEGVPLVEPHAEPRFSLKKLNPDDLALLQCVGRATYEPYYLHIWHPSGMDWYMERCFGVAALRHDFADPNIVYYLATDSTAQIVGFLKFVLQKPLPSGSIADALYLEKIYLMPDWFGKGAGQQLIEWAVEQATAMGREAVWLQVMKTGPYRAYERAGFHIVDETRFEFDLLKEEQRGGWTMMRRI